MNASPVYLLSSSSSSFLLSFSSSLLLLASLIPSFPPMILVHIFSLYCDSLLCPVKQYFKSVEQNKSIAPSDTGNPGGAIEISCIQRDPCHTQCLLDALKKKMRGAFFPVVSNMPVMHPKRKSEC